MARAPLSVNDAWICDPTDDRCVDPPIRPPFRPGISVRHSPSCTGEICALFSCDGGNWRVTGRGTLDRAEWIKGWIITQLFTRGLVDCDEHPSQKRDGGWWADSYRTERDFRSGSKLWALSYSHGGATNEMLVRAKDYAYEAIRPLIKWGIVSGIRVDAIYIANAPAKIMHLKIAVTGPGYEQAFTIEGRRQASAEWLWDEYRAAEPNRTIGRLYGQVRLPGR